MKRTSVLFTIPNFITAGSGQEMLNIVERLDRDSFQPAICVLRKGGALGTEVERRGIPLIEAPFEIPTRPATTLLYRAWKAARVFRPYGFQIWHSFHWSSDYTEPLIAHLAGARAWIYTKKSMNWGSRAWYLRTLLASRVVARNRTMLDRFLGGRWYRPKTRLVWGGADTTRFSPEVSSRLNLRERFGLSSDDVVVACVAQLVRVKGQPTLLEAAARIKGLHVWLVGRALDEAYAEELCQLVQELNLSDRVHFCGHIGDIPALLTEADIFVLPTWTRWQHEEGCPVALLEAMAAGKCCIATDVAGSRDVIEHERSGLLVEPENAVQLSEALRNLIASPEKRRRLGQEARKRIESEFTLEREASQMQAIYQELIG